MKIVSLLVSFILLSCLTEEKCYINNLKWQIPADYLNNEFIKNKPKFIKEIVILVPAGEEAKMFRPDTSSFEYEFNIDGDMVIKNKYAGTKLYTHTSYTYNNCGVQFQHVVFNLFDTSNKDNDTLFSNTASFDKERFLTIDKAKQYTNSRLESFPEKGKSWRIDLIKDSSDPNSVYKTQITYYNNNHQVEKIENISGDIKVTNQYYYSNTGYPDSIVTMFGNEKRGAKIYVNNISGDPLTYIEVDSNGDTLSVANMRYRYDDKANWIEKIIQVRDKNVKNPFTHKSEVITKLIRRKIIYFGN